MLINIVNLIKSGFPIVSWTSNYNLEKSVADLVAGITIGLTLIPQVIAYSSLAGLGPQYGLYSSLCGGIVYSIFGTIPELNIAPTALISLLTYSFTGNLTQNAHAAIFLCFLAGIIEFVCGILHLGFLVDFVSTPVVAAFTSAGAITIATSQLKNLLGLNFAAANFVGVWRHVLTNIQNVKLPDAALGITCCVILLLMRKIKDFGHSPKDGDAQIHKSMKLGKFLWFLSVARNACVVIGCAVVAYVLDKHAHHPFSLTSQVPQGLPSFQLPFVGSDASFGNETSHQVTSSGPIETAKSLGVGILVVPFVAILSNVAIAKSFAKGKVVDASQEMIAVGICNVIGSFFSSYPINASFSRAAVSGASGVKTPLAGIYTGVMVFLALTFLTPYFPYIPKATLAAVIICAVIFMVEVTVMRMIWQMKKIDLIPFFVTLLSCLFVGIEIGILIGVGVDLAFLLYEAARPNILIEKQTISGRDFVRVIPTTSILFPSAEFIKEKILRKNQNKFASLDFEYVVVDCQKINKLDFTAAKCLLSVISDLKKYDKRVIFFKPSEAVAKVIEKITKDTSKIIESDDELVEAIKADSHEYQLAVVTTLPRDRQKNAKFVNTGV